MNHINLNTSHVNLNQDELDGTFEYEDYLNTSHVNLNL